MKSSETKLECPFCKEPIPLGLYAAAHSTEDLFGKCPKCDGRLRTLGGRFYRDGPDPRSCK